MIPQLRKWFEGLEAAGNPEQLAIMKVIVARLLVYDQFEDAHKAAMRQFVFGDEPLQTSSLPSGADPAP